MQLSSAQPCALQPSSAAHVQLSSAALVQLSSAARAPATLPRRPPAFDTHRHGDAVSRRPSSCAVAGMHLVLIDVRLADLIDVLASSSSSFPFSALEISSSSSSSSFHLHRRAHSQTDCDGSFFLCFWEEVP